MYNHPNANTCKGDNYAIYASCRHRLLISETSTFLTEKMRQHAPTKIPTRMIALKTKQS